LVPVLAERVGFVGARDKIIVAAIIMEIMAMV
jgi:hypothetical protein